jgi:hypothetical protein
MSDSGLVLLDAIDQRNRLIQHGSIFAGIALLLIARYAAESNTAATLAFIAVALALFVVASSVWQRWAVDYQGYRSVVENNPFRGERLRIGGVVVAKGRLGVFSHMRATIATPSGKEEIVVRTEATFLRYRCIIRVVRSAAAAAGSDAELLAEVRRRGLV